MRRLSIRVPAYHPAMLWNIHLTPRAELFTRRGSRQAGSEYKFALEGTLSEREIMSFLGSGPEELKLSLESVGFSYRQCQVKLMAEESRKRPIPWK